MSKLILITGAGGFLGRELIKQGLNNSQYNFIAVTSAAEKLNKSVENSRIVFKDRNYIYTEDFHDIDIDCLINCAYPRNENGNDIANGLHYINQVFCEARNAKVKSIINISSQSVYGKNRTQPATENTNLSIDDVYSTGKLCSEMFLNSICNEIPHTSLRMASLIGCNFNQRLVNRIIISALQGATIRITKNNDRIGLLDVEDAANAIFALLQVEPKMWNQFYNIDSSSSLTVCELVNHIKKVFNDNAIEFPNVEITENRSDKDTSVLSLQFNELTGFRSRISIDESILRIFTNIRNDYI